MAAMVSERSASALVKKHRERRIPIRQTIDRKVYGYDCRYYRHRSPSYADNP